MTMISNLAKNILAQGESLSAVLRYQCGVGATALSEAASLIRPGRRIFITGIGASLFASIPLEYALCSAGVDAEAVEAGELLHYRSGLISDSVVIAVSRSGESVEVAKLLETMKGRNRIIGVSNEPKSLLARSSHISIHIGSMADEMVAIQTYTGTLLALCLLANAVTASIDSAAEAARVSLPAFAAQVERSMEALQEWDDFFSGGSPVYLLGRGPSRASAAEGALLFHEVAKSPAVSMASASFRHGPVEVVDRSFRGLIFATQRRTRELDLSLAADLTRFGGRVRVIGAPHAGGDAPFADCELPQVPEALAPLFEIVPVQVAALRLAELRGIRPGSFRYAPQVTVDEAHFGGADRNEG
jgi:glucosamine--fructose-6-phosphate aminotransferase (isomerizing)